MIITLDVARRFWSKVDKGSRNNLACWQWHEETRRPPQFSVVDENGERVNLQARRVSWAIYHGSEPDAGNRIGMKCGNRMCLNPRHMVLDRWDSTHRGVLLAHTRLTVACVKDIRARARRGETLASIAGIYDLAETTVGAIVRRETWKHVVGACLKSTTARPHQRKEPNGS